MCFRLCRSFNILIQLNGTSRILITITFLKDERRREKNKKKRPFVQFEFKAEKNIMKKNPWQ